MAAPARPLRILILTDRDWTHPQGGGTGTNLWGQVSRWLHWGHRVTVVASSYPGAAAREADGALTIHRVGGRSTVFPRVIWRGLRGLADDADVVLEVVNGITFLTPLWLRKPRVTLVHHIHRDHYREEMPRAGRLAAFVLETAPLRWLYRDSRFMTISRASAGQIAEHGIPLERISVNYVGVEAGALGPGERASAPTLLYLGRLKRYKHIESVLDVLEANPGATLDIAGDGDHRAALEDDIARRGLGERVRMHGFVSEDEKRLLLQRAWVNLTASSAEGWCLTVMEAAACGTPSVAMGIGGLPESIDQGRTGLLARDGDELIEGTRRIVGDPELRERMGAAARERAGRFEWAETAERTLAVLEEARLAAGGAAGGSTAREPLWRSLSRSDTGRAAGLAVAVMAANVVSLAFTIVFARLLGASGYGSLASLVSAFLILTVPGQALQLSVAREVSRRARGHDPSLGADIRRWTRSLALLTVAAVAVSLLLRDVLAALIGVDGLEIAAAATLPTGALWLVVSVQRGVLQGTQGYRLVGASVVGEALGRLLFGLVLVGAGLGVTGAFLGTATSLLATALILSVPLHRHVIGAATPGVERAPLHLRDLVGNAWVPVAGLALIAVLQNIDVIVVKHQVSDDLAGAYAVAAVAAKAIIWVGVGLGLYLLPEAARRAAAGQDARPILARTLGLIAAVGLPMVLVYAVAGRPLLEIVFGPELAVASDALPLLGLAMTLLACAYLSVQYLLALRRSGFLWLLLAAAVLEPLLLFEIGGRVTGVAAGLLGLQLVLASGVLAMGFRAGRRATATPAPA